MELWNSHREFQGNSNMEFLGILENSKKNLVSWVCQIIFASEVPSLIKQKKLTVDAWKVVTVPLLVLVLVLVLQVVQVPIQ
jgi:hypothetical protein